MSGVDEIAAQESGMLQHLAARPGGDCRVCDDCWPCEVQRAALMWEYRYARTSLVIYLSLQLIEALECSRLTEAGDLYMRYLGWVPQADTHTGAMPGAVRCENGVQDARHGACAA
jgi:hypothetical protein